MKNKLFALFCFALSLGLAACETDNFEAPESKLEGNIVYQGEPLHLGYNEVNFQLWEPGWQKKGPIEVPVDQDGSYSALLFDAQYKLVFRPNQGPFRTIQNGSLSDTVVVKVNGSQNLDIEVMPYYMIRNAQLSGANRTVTANFKLEQIIADANAKNVERVYLYVNKTAFVDRGNNIANKDLAGGNITDMNNIGLTVNVPAISPAQNYVFARVGLKIAGVEDMLYSPVQKIQI